MKVEAYSINRGETFVLADPPPEWRPGKDVAGTIAVAGDASGFRVGQRVVGHPEHSGWAEYVAVPAERLALLPDCVDAATASALPLAGLTAVRLIRAVGSLPGRTILLTGASGGVGHYFVELAVAGGAMITAVSSSAERGRRLTELGAEVITDVGDAVDRYDVVIDSVGGEVFSAAWRRLSHQGLFIWMGQASRQRPVIDFFDWTGGSNATMRKFLYSATGDNDDDDLELLVRLVATGRLNPEIGVTADWARTPEILSELVNRGIRGNAVLKVDAL